MIKMIYNLIDMIYRYIIYYDLIDIIYDIYS